MKPVFLSRMLFLRHVVWQEFTDVSQDYNVFIFMAEEHCYLFFGPEDEGSVSFYQTIRRHIPLSLPCETPIPNPF
jgi:hypothetical protein